MAVNDSLLLLSEQQLSAGVAFFSLDNEWIKRHRGHLFSFAGEKHVALPLETWPECGGIPRTTYLRWSHEQGLSEDPHFINTGCHSGYGALGLAYLKRARQVRLIGFDLIPDSTHEHFQLWADNYRTTVAQFRNRGVDVRNLNPTSYIDAFPRIDPSELLG